LNLIGAMMKYMFRLNQEKIVSLFVHNVETLAPPMIILKKDAFCSRPFGVFLSFCYVPLNETQQTDLKGSWMRTFVAI
ncbi:MAG: hypothetical protein OEV64_12820, partial [Desulfobulbaceae bacterium]|nr:hypothetical protein [Desulfobulbaceae bacterium]